MKLTRGEFCQFNLTTRSGLLKEFGRAVFKKKIKMHLVSVYRIFDFYVEVYEHLPGQTLEKIEPVANIVFLDVYRDA
jgi:hypothetical protein